MSDEGAHLRSLLVSYREKGWTQLTQPIENLLHVNHSSRENRLNLIRKRLGLPEVYELREGPYSRVFGNDSWYQLNLEYSDFIGRQLTRLPLRSKFYLNHYPFRVLLIKYTDQLVQQLFDPPFHRLIDLYITENNLNTLPEKIFAPLYQIDDLAILEPNLDFSNSSTQDAFHYIHPSIRFLELYADSDVRFLPDTLLENLSALSLITTRPEIHKSFAAYCKLAHPDLNLYIEEPVPFHITHEKY
jgi:hypothetical protein